MMSYTKGGMGGLPFYDILWQRGGGELGKVWHFMTKGEWGVLQIMIFYDMGDGGLEHLNKYGVICKYPLINSHWR